MCQRCSSLTLNHRYSVSSSVTSYSYHLDRPLAAWHTHIDFIKDVNKLHKISALTQDIDILVSSRTDVNI